MANTAQVNSILDSIEDWNRWRTNNPTLPINLQHANLSKAKLSHINLSQANLNQAKLRKANLEQANLSQADLSNANLSQVNLQGANLQRVNFTDAKLIITNLYEADLREANLRKANLSKANLSHARLGEANMQGADLTGANLSGATLVGTDLLGANLTNANLTGANLTNANLTGANLTNANLTKTELINNKQQGTLWSKATREDDPIKVKPDESCQNAGLQLIVQKPLELTQMSQSDMKECGATLVLTNNPPAETSPRNALSADVISKKLPSKDIPIEVFPSEQDAPTEISRHHFLIIEENHETRSFILNDSTYVIGRDAYAKIKLVEQSVSRYHAILVRLIDAEKKSLYSIVDGDINGKRSKNGMSVNAIPCRSQILATEDKITLGKATIHYYMEELEASTVESEIRNRMLSHLVEKS